MAKDSIKNAGDSPSTTAAEPRGTVPLAVYVLAFVILAFVTSEFMVSGLMNDLANDLKTSISAIGYLVAVYALSMVLVSPLASVLLTKISPRRALFVISVAFIVGELIAAAAPDYFVIVIGRIITGGASGAAYGITLSIAANAVPEKIRGRAVGLVMGGNTVGTVVGLPLASFLGNTFGWRWAFAFVALLAALALTLSAIYVPRTKREAPLKIASHLRELRNGRLWLAYATSGLLIGSVFALFSYFSPILTSRAQFPQSLIPVILAAYGVACVVGITVVSRFADRFPLTISIVGAVVILGAGLIFLVSDTNKVTALLGVAALGLAGVSLNPAFAVRVMRVGGVSFVINTMHTSIICLGIFLGSSVGGLIIEQTGRVESVYILSLVLAVAAIISLVSQLGRARLEIMEVRS